MSTFNTLNSREEHLMTTHDLKIQAEYFAEVINGNKTFEIRNNDRNFVEGDKVVLHEMAGNPGEGGYVATGRRCAAEIGYVCDYSQPEGQVVFSLLNVDVEVG